MKKHSSFEDSLRKKGKKRSVIERNIRTVSEFHKFLNENEISIHDLTPNTIDLYVKKIENSKKSAKGPLYILMNYFEYLGDNDLYRYTSDLREERTQKSRRLFPLSGFLDIDPQVIETLSYDGIKNVNQMIINGKTVEQ